MTSTMQYTRLGSTGLKVSRLCLGAMTYGSKQWRPWVLSEEEAWPFIRRALDRVTDVAQKRGVSTSKMNHLDDAVAALSIKLDEAELKLLTEHYRPRAIMAHT
jgi:aryl-alcohol dehydrogenase-like predicted oxidoreductase